jgi:formiminoglutamase
MHRPPDPALWTGREDPAEGPRALRWHQRVAPWRPGAAAGVALVGFACDAGVVRNGGRAGAAEGPAALRRALANLAWHRSGPAWDAGDVFCEGDGLEAAQAELGSLVARLLGEGQRPIVLGGGHEVALGTFLGLAEHLAARSPASPPRTAVVNLDAHLDLREGPRPTSGTPFRDVARECERRGWSFRYLCLGMDEDANTGALLDGAARIGAAVVTDQTLLARGEGWARDAVTAFLDGVEAAHLSVDLDGLSAAVAPAVSAPAARGLPLHLVEAVVDAVAASGRLAVADVAELCPRLDPDGRTARAAARVVARLAGRG